MRCLPYRTPWMPDGRRPFSPLFSAETGRMLRAIHKSFTDARKPHERASVKLRQGFPACAGGQTTGSGSRSLKGRDPSSGSVGFRSCVILSAAKDSAVLAAQVPGSHPLGEEFSFHENVGSIARNSP